MSSTSTRNAALLTVVLAASSPTTCFTSRADEKPARSSQPATASDEQHERRRARLLEQMRQLARETVIRFQDDGRQPALVEAPLFRYDDQPRRFLDATMWVWTDGGRPVAFEKIEAMDRGRPTWATLFTSVAEGLLTVQWDESREYRSTSPGLDFRSLPDAPMVPSKSSARRLAAREVVRDFSARILTGIRPDTTEAMRLLPAPIFEYTEPETKQFLGAVFGLTTGGTNPDVLILLEPREANAESVWNYSVARMTTCGVTLKYREAIVWQAEFCVPPASEFPTWKVFYTDREKIDDPPGGDDGSRSTRPQPTPSKKPSADE